MSARDLSLLFLAWLGALVISYGVYEWRQENDLDDLRDRLGDIEGGIGLGGGGPDFEPDSAAAGPVDLTIVSATDDDETIVGVLDGKGSLVLRVENVSLDPFGLATLTVSGTTKAGLGCQVFVGQDNEVTSLASGESDELRLIWDCEELATIVVQGQPFQVKD
jgi:hypothetical protein